MLDAVLTLILIILSALLEKFLHMNNAVLEKLLELVPIIVLSIRLLYNRPRVYMYFLGFVNRNVKYNMMIQLENCNVDEEFYSDICKRFRNLYGNDTGKEVCNNTGDFLCRTYIQVDACSIEITLSLENSSLYIELNSKTKFKYFINDVERVHEILSKLFSESNCNHKNERISIKIRYLNKQQDETNNPFLNKFFNGFNKPIFKLEYVAKGGTKFLVNNIGIMITGNSIIDIKEDIKKEMLLF